MTHFFHRFSCPVMKQFHANLWPVSATPQSAPVGQNKKKEKKGGTWSCENKERKKINPDQPCSRIWPRSDWITALTPQTASLLSPPPALPYCVVFLSVIPLRRSPGPPRCPRGTSASGLARTLWWVTVEAPSLSRRWSYGREASAWVVLCVSVRHNQGHLSLFVWVSDLLSAPPLVGSQVPACANFFVFAC